MYLDYFYRRNVVLYIIVGLGNPGKEELLKTDKFISLKSISIGKDESQEQDEEYKSENENPVTYRDTLLSNGFKKTDNPMIVEKRIGDSLYEVDWYAKQLRYT